MPGFPDKQAVRAEILRVGIVPVVRAASAEAALADLTVLLDERWKGNRAVLAGEGLAQAELVQGTYYTTGGLGRGGGRPWR